MIAALLARRPEEAPSRAARGIAAARVDVLRCRAQRSEAVRDLVADETPVSLVYNGIAHAVMMATPADLEELAVGFSLSEGIVAEPRDILDLDVDEGPRGVTIAIGITARRIANLRARRRSLAGRTGCGLCGVESLDAVAPAIAPVDDGEPLDAAAIPRAIAAMVAAQPLRDATGATHAAGWMDADGRVGPVREDIGRHNALDKLVGALVAARIDRRRGAVLLTSRASHEMVQKAAACGIGTVIAVSAATALAVRRAHALNVTLAGFARGGAHVIYAHGWRLGARASEGVPA